MDLFYTAVTRVMIKQGQNKTPITAAFSSLLSVAMNLDSIAQQIDADVKELANSAQRVLDVHKQGLQSSMYTSHCASYAERVSKKQDELRAALEVFRPFFKVVTGENVADVCDEVREETEKVAASMPKAVQK